MASIKELSLKLEYAVLEQNINKISLLFQEIINGSGDKAYLQLLTDLQDLVSCLVNGEYLKALTTSAALKFFGETPETSDETTEGIDKYLIKRTELYLESADEETLLISYPQEAQLSRQLVVLLVGTACLQLFVQQNWTGPPISDTSIQFLPSSFEAQRQEGSLQKTSIEKLSSDGEGLYNRVNGAVHLLIADVLLVQGLNKLHLLQSSHVWALRCLSIKQRITEEHCNTIMNKIFELIKHVTEATSITCIEQNRSVACQIHLEIGHLYIYYHESAKAKEHFLTAQSALGIKFDLTGALGKKTKFQQEFLSVLKLDIHRDDSSEIQSVNSVEVNGLPKNVFLDNEVLLDKVKFKDPGDDEQPSLSPLEKAVILSFCILSQKSQAMQPLTSEELVAYIESIVIEPSSWPVQTLALHIRSKLEKGSTKKIDRSMMQLQVLVDAVKLDAPKAVDRHLLFYCLPLQPSWTVQDDLAQVLMSMKAVKSALDIYESLQMWENMIICYQMLGRYEKAETLVRDQLKERETSALWCLLGDTTKDISCYEKAWEVSNHRSARAQRSLGLLYLREKKYAECIPHLQKSLELNSLQGGIWFSLGCATMAVGQSELARTAFHRCVALDSDNAEAWNNLANVYLQLKNKEKAHTVLKEALRASYEDWRIWANYLVISTQIYSFNDSIFAFHRLMDLKEKYKDIEILGLLVRAVCEGVKDNKGQSATGLRPKLIKLLGRITSNITNDSEIWYLYSKLYLMTDSTEDNEKGLNFLIKAHRISSQAPSWENDVTKFQDAINMTLNLAEVYTEVSKKKTDPSQAIQLLSSAKLILKQLITKATKHHTDSVTGEVKPELLQGVQELNTKLTSIIETITVLKS